MSLEIRIDATDAATPALAAIAASLTRRKPLHSALGKRAEVKLRRHYAKREAEPNKRGWPKQHFWGRIRKASAFVSADERDAIAGISDPAIAQKIHGGKITPKEGKYLTIPAIAAAYGRSPRVVEGLTPMVRYLGGRRRAVALQREGTVWYWLVTSVTQRRDPRALPADTTMRNALLDEAREYLARLS